MDDACGSVVGKGERKRESLHSLTSRVIGAVMPDSGSSLHLGSDLGDTGLVATVVAAVLRCSSSCWSFSASSSGEPDGW